MTAINFDQLNMMTGGDKALALEVLGIFRSQTEVWSPLLDVDNPTEQWADACHTIKGAARSIGAEALGMVCEAAERRGREGDVKRVEAAVLLSDVKDQLTNTIEALAKAEFELASQVGTQQSAC